jgi:hypothetical protein
MSESELKQPTSGKLVRGKPFEAGWDGGPGREKGSHNKTTRILKEAMLLAAAQLGDLSGIAREDLPTPNIETGKDVLLQFFERVVDGLREAIDFDLQWQKLAENIEKRFGLTFTGPTQVADQFVFASLDARRWQILALDTREIAELCSGEQHCFLQDASGLVVAAFLAARAEGIAFLEWLASRRAFATCW